MKRTIILLTFIFAVSMVNAQKGKVTSALNFKDTGKLDKALEAINESIDPKNEKSESSITWPRTWEVRGEIYQSIFQSTDANIKKLEADPLGKALESYKKALQLDDKDRFGKSVKIKLTLLNTDLTNQAVEAFKQENYKLALKSFEEMLEISSLPVIKADNPDAIDTVIMFNAGLAAFNAQDYNTAIKYYDEVAKLEYNQGRTYQLLASAYELKGDTIGALDVLKKGFEKYPSDNVILVKMINIYITTKKTDEAMKYLDLAIEQDPNNSSYYFAQGSLFDQVGKQEEAIKSYEKSISISGDEFNPNYNLGALYYNKGVKQFEVANSLPTNVSQAEYDAEKAKADIWFKKALPYMEKCHQINDKDPSTIESLKNIYYRMQDMEKYKEMDEKLKNL